MSHRTLYTQRHKYHNLTPDSVHTIRPELEPIDRYVPVRLTWIAIGSISQILPVSQRQDRRAMNHIRRPLPLQYLTRSRIWPSCTDNFEITDVICPHLLLIPVRFEPCELLQLQRS